MKTTSMLHRPYGRSVIDPLKLKLKQKITTPIKKAAQEIGILKLLGIILGLSTIIGLLVFWGAELL